MKLRARFRRFLHLLKFFPWHQAITLWSSEGRLGFIGCICGAYWYPSDSAAPGAGGSG